MAPTARDSREEKPPCGLHLGTYPRDYSWVDSVYITSAVGRQKPEGEGSPGAALSTGWGGDNQVRLHCRWRLLGLAEAERAAPDLGMRNVSIGCEHETPGAGAGPGGHAASPRRTFSADKVSLDEFTIQGTNEGIVLPR